METATKKKKKTTLDLREEANRLKAEIERELNKSHGEITDHIDELFEQLADLEPEVKDKIESLRWAKVKVQAQVEANKAVEKFYKEEAKKFKKTKKAREKNIERIKDMVLLNLNTLEERSVRLSDGNKIYVRDYFKATVEDEEAAYADLQGTDIVERQSVIDAGGMDDVQDAILSVLEHIQTADGEPVEFPPEVHTKLMEALDIVNAADDQYKFDGRALNSEVERLHEERKEKLAPIHGELNDVSGQLDAISERLDEDISDEERAELQTAYERLTEEMKRLHATAEEIEGDYSISGVSYEINEAVFGL